MTERKLYFYRSLPHSPRRLNRPGCIRIPFDELALAAAKETLITGLSAGAWVSFFENQLNDTRQLIWLGDGLGRGGELRRSFSNILGRIFARWYLQSREGVRALIPIERAGSPITPFLRVDRKRGESGDMPDWIGCTRSHLVLAEAKGRHTGGRWDRKVKKGELPPIVDFAMEQTERAEPFAFGGVRQSQRWAVASRWGTVTNKQQPWLIAKDPVDEAPELKGMELMECTRALIDMETVLLVHGAGFSSGISKSIDHDELYGAALLREFRGEWAPCIARYRLESDSGTFEGAGLNVLFTPTGFLAIKDSEDVQRARALSDAFDQTLLLQIDAERLPKPPDAQFQRVVDDTLDKPARRGRAVISNQIALAPLRRGDQLKFEFTGGS